jgi:hypothetical protein
MSASKRSNYLDWPTVAEDRQREQRKLQSSADTADTAEPASMQTSMSAANA